MILRVRFDEDDRELSAFLWTGVDDDDDARTIIADATGDVDVVAAAAAAMLERIVSEARQGSP